MDNTFIDLTDDKYTPDPDQTYIFAGFKYKNGMFVANYEIYLPNKGDSIVLNDGNVYKVLKMDGTQAFVFSMSTSDPIYYNDVSMATPFGDKNGVSYCDSSITKQIEQEWLPSIHDNYIEMYEAIVLKDMYQNMFNYNEGEPGGEYIAKGTSGNDESNKYYITGGYSSVMFKKPAFILDVQDILDYLGYDVNSDNNILSYSAINDLISVDTDLWLRNSCSTDDTHAWYIEYDDLSLKTAKYDDECKGYRIAFIIDLSKEGVYYYID